MCVMLVKLSDHPRRKRKASTALFAISYWIKYIIKQVKHVKKYY